MSTPNNMCEKCGKPGHYKSECTHGLTFPEWTRSGLADLPVISIRQPWANAILHGGKNIENRNSRTGIRGNVLIHAATTYGPPEMAAWWHHCRAHDLDADVLFEQCKGPHGFQIGGIIGYAYITECVSHHSSRWFSGPYGYVLTNPQPLEFVHLRGMPGFFKMPKLG